MQCSNGSCCSWEGKLGSLEAHTSTCQHTLITCPNQCLIMKKMKKKMKKKIKNKGGRFSEEGALQVPRKDLDKHLRECPNRSHNCPRCNEEGRYSEMTTTHFESCSKVKVTCPNAECGTKRLRGDIPEHRQTCPFEEEACKYAEIGCEQKRMRKMKDKHESDDKFHFHLALGTMLDIKQQLNTLVSEKQATAVKQLPATTPSYTFKIANFSRYKEAGNPLFFRSSKNRFETPPFYTHKGGYKMRVEICANGFGSGADTHVSVVLWIMEGENDRDNHLPWPFKATATITLLNQLQEQGHHIRDIMLIQQHGLYPGGDDGYCFEVDHYCSHEKLGHNEATNCQYLKDDCLYFRVTVTPTGHKPWLVCNI